MTTVKQVPKLDTSQTLKGEKREKLDAILNPMILTDGTIKQFMEVFEEHMKLANSPDEETRNTSDHLMMNTFIRELMDGTEQGDYLGLDLGSTNFRVVLVKFKDGHAVSEFKKFTLPDAVLCGPSAGVFDFIAESIADFMNEQGLQRSEHKIPLGFVFSFPSVQLALNKQRLLTWTQTFKCPDGPGEDPVALLEEAIQRKAKDLPVEVVVVMSDTTAILMAGNYLDKQCRIGLIIGTGSNAAFVENLENINKWTGDRKEPKHVIVNVECGSTGDKGCLDFCRTEYERELDNNSNHPGSFTFEKSYSGHYLGELCRLVLARCNKDGILFGGKPVNLVNEIGCLTSAQITFIESSSDQNVTRKVLEEFNLGSVASGEDISIIQEVCEFISRRGAYLVAAAMSVLVNRTGLPAVTIAVDGSLYEKHPKFHSSMMEVLEKFCPKTKVNLILAKDGSGLGGAFGAVSALRQNMKGIRCS